MKESNLDPSNPEGKAEAERSRISKINSNLINVKQVITWQYCGCVIE